MYLICFTFISLSVIDSDKAYVIQLCVECRQVHIAIFVLPKMSKFCCLVLFLCFVCCTNGYNILAILSDRGRSHFIAFEPLMRALAKKGHSVTVMSHYLQKQPPERYKDVSLTKTGEMRINVFGMDEFQGRRWEIYRIPLRLARLGYDACVEAFSLDPVREFMKTNETFDLLIAEYFHTDCLAGFAHRFKVPVIGLTSSAIISPFNDRLANPVNPSYIPNSFLGYTDRMSFFERLENTIFYLYQEFVWRVLTEIPANKLAREFFGDDMPSLRDIVYNSSAVLVNFHFSYGFPRPYVPGVIEVGGMHVGKPKKLPEVRRTVCFLLCYLFGCLHNRHRLAIK